MVNCIEKSKLIVEKKLKTMGTTTSLLNQICEALNGWKALGVSLRFFPLDVFLGVFVGRHSHHPCIVFFFFIIVID